MKLSTLVQHDIGSLIGEDCEFNTISTDTRTLSGGDLFVALRGDNFDAHEMLGVAIEKGACAVVIERKVTGKNIAENISGLLVDDSTEALGKIAALYRDSFDGRVVALTGSCGKTSVKGMLKNICETAGSCIATSGNFNNHIGVPLTLLRLNVAADYAVIEAGTSGKKEIQYLTNLIKPEIALVTNVKASHLEGFGSEAAIALEKSDIYSHDLTTVAVVNLDDPYMGTMLEKAGNRKIIGFSLRPKEALVEEIKHDVDLVCLQHYQSNNIGLVNFQVECFNESLDINMKVLGKHNVENALAAIACAYALGINAGDIRSGLEKFTGTPGRMQYVEGINQAMIINDTYNANPGSMNAAINFLAQHENSILICGDMGELGNDTQNLHEQVGKYAKEQKIARLFAVGESAKFIARAFGNNAKCFSDKEELIAEIKPLLNEKTVVLIKGSRSTKMETVVEALSYAEVQN